jgi:hypothetical protein
MEKLALTFTLLASVLGALWVALDINRRQQHRTWPQQWAVLWWATRDAMTERCVGWLVTVWLAAASFLDISPLTDAFGYHGQPVDASMLIAPAAPRWRVAARIFLRRPPDDQDPA